MVTGNTKSKVDSPYMKRGTRETMETNMSGTGNKNAEDFLVRRPTILSKSVNEGDYYNDNDATKSMLMLILF
jgi:hypothetical protein